MRACVLVVLAMFFPTPIQAADACMTIHGRAHLYGGDGQLRIWHIGTHHEYEPDDSSWDRVREWLEAGVKDKSLYVTPASAVYLFADFVICPTEPFKSGTVQRAKVVSVRNRRYISADQKTIIRSDSVPSP
jgi:hypothetical protein